MYAIITVNSLTRAAMRPLLWRCMLCCAGWELCCLCGADNVASISTYDKYCDHREDLRLYLIEPHARNAVRQNWPPPADCVGISLDTFATSQSRVTVGRDLMMMMRALFLYIECICWIHFRRQQHLVMLVFCVCVCVCMLVMLVVFAA